MPLAVSHVCLFVAYLSNKKFAPKTLSTYLSAIAYIHKITDHPDPTTSFLVSKLIAGAYRLRPSFDTRLPITVAILNKLVNSVKVLITDAYLQVLYSAMFLFAFNALTRIGEITLNKTANNNLLQFSDLAITTSKSGQPFIEVTFRCYKYHLAGPPVKLTFSHGPTDISAVQAMIKYIRRRGHHPGPLFCLQDLSPVPRSVFDKQLHQCLSFCKLDGSKYKGHSFRIGAASFLAGNNLSDAQIRACGRWRSNAFKKYIRISTQKTD